jgi:predicted nucleotidyltransferase component of viral defense system
MLDAIARSPLARVATFGGATALAAVYLHHRRSEDLDLFLPRDATRVEIAVVTAAARRLRLGTELRADAVRQMVVLSRRKTIVGHVDLASFPYEPIDKPTIWRGLRADSLLDMAVNKVQAVLTRARPRDYVDLYFLLQVGPERDLDRLLVLARSKFDVGASRISLGEQLLKVSQLREEDLPRMLKPIVLAEMRAFIEEEARQLVRRGP